MHQPRDGCQEEKVAQRKKLRLSRLVRLAGYSRCFQVAAVVDFRLTASQSLGGAQVRRVIEYGSEDLPG